MMNQITYIEATIVATTFSFCSFSQLMYFILKLHNYSPRDTITSRLRGFSCDYRYSFGCWLLYAMAEIILLSVSWPSGDDIGAVAYWCLQSCMIAIIASYVFFLNILLLFPPWKMLSDLEWHQFGNIISYTSIALQIPIFVGAILSALYWLRDTAAQLLLIWAIPLPASLGYAIMATCAVLKIDSFTNPKYNCFLYLQVAVSWAAFVVPVFLLFVALSSPPVYHFAFYTAQCSFAVVLLAENCVMEWWQQRDPPPAPPAPPSSRTTTGSMASSTLYGTSLEEENLIGLGPMESRQPSTLSPSEHEGRVDTDVVSLLAPPPSPEATPGSTDEDDRIGLVPAPSEHEDRVDTGVIHKGIDTDDSLFSRIEHGLPFRADVENLQKVLDIGMGNGAWALAMVDKYPKIHIITTDTIPDLTLKSSQITRHTKNVNDSWPFPPCWFDLIHIRWPSVYIRDWPSLLTNAYISLKEGGYLEFRDITLPKSSETNTWLRSSQTAREIGRQAGFRFDILDTDVCQKLMMTAGFDIMPNTRRLVNLGQWKTSREGLEKDALDATIHKLQFIQGFGNSRGYTDALQPRDVRGELEDSSAYPCVEFIRMIGQKPLNHDGTRVNNWI